jgi:hypothetical protein
VSTPDVGPTHTRVLRVHDLAQARVEHLSTSFAPRSPRSTTGTVTARIDGEAGRELWHRAARRAGRQLGVRVRTGVSWVDCAVVWALVHREGRRARLVPDR